MTPQHFTTLALALPEATQGGHQGQTDFRVRKKIFATMNPAKDVATLKLTPEDQTLLIEAISNTAYPANGSWGAKGWTKLTLSTAPDDLTFWIHRAWTTVAPASLARDHN